jgi:hypothetical protein
VTLNLDVDVQEFVLGRRTKRWSLKTRPRRNQSEEGAQ